MQEKPCRHESYSTRPLLGLKILNPFEKGEQKEHIQDRVSCGGIGTVSELRSVFQPKHLVYGVYCYEET